MNQAPQARISGMNFKTRTKIADLLDIERPFNDDIRMVGNKVGFTNQEIQLIWNKRGFERPTLKVLEQWQKKPDATIRKFRDILVGMDRCDVVDIIDKEYSQLAAPVERDQEDGGDQEWFISTMLNEDDLYLKVEYREIFKTLPWVQGFAITGKNQHRPTAHLEVYYRDEANRGLEDLVVELETLCREKAEIRKSVIHFIEERQPVINDFLGNIC